MLVGSLIWRAKGASRENGSRWGSERHKAQCGQSAVESSIDSCFAREGEGQLQRE